MFSKVCTFFVVLIDLVMRKKSKIIAKLQLKIVKIYRSSFNRFEAGGHL